MKNRGAARVYEKRLTGPLSCAYCKASTTRIEFKQEGADMNPLRRTKLLTLRGLLLRRGFSLRGFAREHGYNENTVLSVARRYAGRTGEPRDGLALEILRKLREVAFGTRPQAVEPEGFERKRTRKGGE
jgi:hypothetical protein